MKRILLCAFAMTFTAAVGSRAESGILHGTVAEQVSGTSKPLVSATVQWIGKPSQGVLSDKRGAFSLSRQGITDQRIVVRYVGYAPDTLAVAGLDSIAVVFSEPLSAGDVVVKGSTEGSEILTSTIRTHEITETAIEKDACCDLSGCFNTSAAVEPNVTDFVTDKRELQVLGMSGVYNQVLIDGMPMLMTGLNSGYGLNLIPGPFIKRISVVKGANSVLQGDESITGIVDVRIKDPKDIDGAFANLFVNAHMEKQLNLAVARELSDSWSALVAGHVTLPSMRIDDGGDSFLDMPLTTRYSAFTKWKYEQEPGSNEGLVSTVFAKYTNEERVGGDRFFEPHHDLGGTHRYGQTVNTNRIEGYAHLVQFLRDPKADEPSGKLSLSVAGALHDQDSYFGATRYDGKQRTLYTDLRAETKLTPEFMLRGGVDYRTEDIDETIDLGSNPLNKTYGGNYAFDVWSAGPYAEAVWTLFDDALTLMPGVRMEYGSNIDRETSGETASQLSTRIFALYRPTELTTFRASFGTGARPVRLWSENSTVLAAGRNVPGISSAPLSEKGLNFGAGAAHIVDIEGVLTTFSLDYYRTELEKQVYFDYESGSDLQLATGRARSHSVQAEIAADLSAEWHAKIAYNYLEAVREESGIEKQAPFTAKHKMLATLSFAPAELPWMFDANLHWYGRQRIPSTAHLPEEYRRPDFSEPYALLNTQVTYRWQTLDLYAGVENLLNFRQNDPVVDPAHPFSRYFDTSYIWGPVKGRELYAGVRYTLNLR